MLCPGSVHSVRLAHVQLRPLRPFLDVPYLLLCISMSHTHHPPIPSGSKFIQLLAFCCVTSAPPPSLPRRNSYDNAAVHDFVLLFQLFALLLLSMHILFIGKFPSDL